MAEINVKLSRKPADIHAARPVTGRKPEPSRRAQAQHASGYIDFVCWNCWAVNVRPQGELMLYECWNCGMICEI